MAYASPEADCKRIAKAMVDVFAANNEHACYHILDLDTEGVKKFKIIYKIVLTKSK